MLAGILAQPQQAGSDATPTAAVIVNYCTPLQTIRAASSLQMFHAVSEIIVVDNASPDDSADRLGNSLSGGRLLKSERNGGFAAGCNIGIREALRLGAQRVLLLNSDVVVRPGTLEALSAALHSDRGLGVVSPIVLSAQDSTRVQSLGIGYNPRTGRMRHPGAGQATASTPPFGCLEVDAVDGCTMLINREVFDRIGLLDEGYFFGFEDLDFCLRARAAGFKSACVANATVEHEGNLSIGRTSARRIYFATRNHLRLVNSFGPPSPVSRWFRTGFVLALNLAHVLLTSNVSMMDGLRGFVSGARDHFAGRYGSDFPAPSVWG